MRWPASVAIVGMSCRLPGAANLHEFWQLLLHGWDAITPVPAGRVALSHNGWGGFIDGVGHFDLGFFGLAPAEVAAMDPQQRLWLELAWEAAEDGGIVPAKLAASRTGVFTGQSAPDYAMLSASLAADTIGTYTNAGLSAAITANRLAYLWDLRGPSLTVDTACSSSLVAIHLAAQSLLLGECDMAFCGGVNVMLSPVPQAGADRLNALSPDGRCRPFDAAANGYVRAEGGGCLVLKRLDDALRDGNGVYAVIEGSAVNQDGRTNGLTAPSGRAQSAVIADALQAAGLRPQQIGYVEAHGTGTRLGDPIEARALHKALGALLIGSVKANLGHLEAAAGVAGLIKTALMRKHARIAPSPHFREPNPGIDFAGWGLQVVTQTMAWPEAPYAGVSSFGFGGTNAHVILGPAPAKRRRLLVARRKTALVTVSARSRASLTSLADSYADSVERARTWNAVKQLAAASNTLRQHFEWRRGIAANSKAELIAQLRSPSPGPESTVSLPARRLGFVFSGHGGQWEGMARTLLGTDQAFTDELSRCDRAFRPHIGFSVIEALRKATSAQLTEVAVAQPLIVAVQLGLTAALAAQGIVPDTVTGHSVGEIPAAVTAGKLTLAEAALLLRKRNAAVAPAVGTGYMAAVDLAASAVTPYLTGAVAIAAINSPRACVIAGPTADMRRVVAELRAAGREVREINVTYPSHCPLMAGPAATLRRSLNGIRGDANAYLDFYSTATGEEATASILDANYWAAHLAAPVRLADTVTAMLKDGVSHLVEIGPHPVLLTAIGETIVAAQRRAVALGTLRRGQPSPHGVLDIVGQIYEAGWNPLFPACIPSAAHVLPLYAFDRRPVPTFGIAGHEADRDNGSEPEDDLRTRLEACIETRQREAMLRAEMLVLLDHVLPAQKYVNDREHMAFHDLGLDSLMATEMRNRLEKALRTTLSVALLWANPTVAQLASALAVRLDGDAENSLLQLLDEVDAELGGSPR